MNPRNAQRASHDAHGHFDVIAGMDKACQEALFERCKTRSVPKGKAVWMQGHPADHLVVILSGKVMSWHEAANGKAGAIGFWGPGDIAGLGDMGTTRTRQHTLRSLETCRLLVLSFEDFDGLVREHSEFAVQAIRALSVRLRWVSQLAVGLTTASALERVCAVLLALTRHFGLPHRQGVLIDLKLTNEQLATICGISRQFTNITLQTLRERGLLIGKPALVLTDVAELERLAASL